MKAEFQSARDRDRKSTTSTHAGGASAALNPIPAMQQQAGNQAVQALLRQSGIHAKLAVSLPDDPDEREADQVADRITRAHGAPGEPSAKEDSSRICAGQEIKELKQSVQRAPLGGPQATPVPPCTALEVDKLNKGAEASRKTGVGYVTAAARALGTVMTPDVLCAFTSNFNTPGDDPAFQARRLTVSRYLNDLARHMRSQVPYACKQSDDPVCAQGTTPGVPDTAAYVVNHVAPINFCPMFRDDPTPDVAIHEFAHLIPTVDDSGGYGFGGKGPGLFDLSCKAGNKFKADGDILVHTADALTGFVLQVGESAAQPATPGQTGVGGGASTGGSAPSTPSPQSGANIQPKVAASNPDVPSEREADQVAGRIMRARGGAPISSPCSCAEGGEMCEECQQKQGVVARETQSNAYINEAPAVVTEVLGSPGLPLADSSRRTFEPKLGRDLSGVRVHDDSMAAEAASSVNALAYTVGNHIVFGAGRYTPGTNEGDRLLAHELVHTIQQGGDHASHPRSAPRPVQRQAQDPTQASGSGDLDQRYQAALAKARTAQDDDSWQNAAELLNGFSPPDIQKRLDALTAREVANIQKGAVARVGPESNVARMAVPKKLTTAELDQKYQTALAEARESGTDDKWQVAAELLNGFSNDDIQRRLHDLSPAELFSLHQGAVHNRAVGPDSTVAQMTESAAPLLGGYDDYKKDVDYLDNFDIAAYDPSSHTVHLFFADGGEAIVKLPLASGPVLVFEKKSFLDSPGPNDLKIYPTVQNSSTVPYLVQWLAAHATEMEQSDLLLSAGTQTLNARSVPPDLWWLALLAPAAALGARFLAARMRPGSAGSNPEPGEKPIIKAPRGESKGGNPPGESPANRAAETEPTVISNVRVESLGADSFVIIAAEGRIQCRFNAKTGQLSIDDVAATGGKGQGIGTELYRRAIEEATKSGEVKSISGFMAKDNARAIKLGGGDITTSPHAKILDKLGYTQHTYDPATQRVVSTRPNQ